jgi:hypothetical protein
MKRKEQVIATHMRQRQFQFSDAEVERLALIGCLRYALRGSQHEDHYRGNTT